MIKAQQGENAKGSNTINALNGAVNPICVKSTKSFTLLLLLGLFFGGVYNFYCGLGVAFKYKQLYGSY